MAIFNNGDDKVDKENNGTTLKKVKAHKTLGEYKTVIVYPTNYAQQNTSIFVSIGLYTNEFQPETEVSLPQGIIDFLKTEATAVKHVYDPNGTSENGQKGVHGSKNVKKYVVETV